MNLQNMAPNAKRAMLLTAVFGALAAGLYLFALEPTETALAKAVRALQSESASHRALMADLARADEIRAGREKAEAALAAYRPALLEPLLESTAMRAKALVDALAVGCGLTGMEYEALPPIDLPVFGAAPRRRFARCPIRITCTGSYQAAVSFLRCVERERPLVALQSLSVTARATPDAQQVVLVLEWPMARPEVTK